MRLKLLIAAMVAILSTPAESRTCQWTKADTVQIERAVRAMFDALKADDQRAFRRAVTTDFMAFELGRRMSADDLFTIIFDSHRSGRVINWSIGPMMIRGDCNSAWAAWDNVGSAGIPPNIAPRRWMESAVLRRSPTGWRVEFLHSTVIAPPPAR